MFTKLLLPWKSNMYYIFLCACVRVCGFAGSLARVCTRVALLTQHAKRICYIILSSMAFLVTHVSALSHKQHDFRKRKLLNKKCVLIFSTDFIWNIILRRIERDMVLNVKTSLCEVPIILVRFNKARIFSKCFREKKNSDIKFNRYMLRGSRVVPCGRTEKKTSMTKLIVAFRNCANAPKNHVLMLYKASHCLFRDTYIHTYAVWAPHRIVEC